MKNAIATLVILIAVSTASAAPVLTWDKQAVGAYDVYTMGVLGNQGPDAWNLFATFTASNGSFNQDQVDIWGTLYHADTLTQANQYNPAPDYEKATDTWWYDDNWTETAPNQLDIQSDTQIDIKSLGSIAGETFVSNPMVQFAVTPGTTISWTGRLSYAGGGVDIEGSIPEPATMSLLVLGGLGALIRRRKAASFRKARKVR